MPPLHIVVGGGPRVVVSTAAFHARVRGSVPGLGGFKETKMFLPYPRVKVSIVGSLRDREVACSASDRQGSNFESCVWRTVSSQSSHHPQEVLLAQFSLYVHKGGLKPESLFHIVVCADTLSEDRPSIGWPRSTKQPNCFNVFCKFAKLRCRLLPCINNYTIMRSQNIFLSLERVGDFLRYTRSSYKKGAYSVTEG